MIGIDVTKMRQMSKKTIEFFFKFIFVELVNFILPNKSLLLLGTCQLTVCVGTVTKLSTLQWTIQTLVKQMVITGRNEVGPR